MTPLRQRMVEDMRLHGYAASTQDLYVHTVARLASFYGRSPAGLNEEELRQYFLHLILKRKLAPPTITIALSAIKFLYEKTLGREWPVLKLVRPDGSALAAAFAFGCHAVCGADMDTLYM